MAKQSFGQNVLSFWRLVLGLRSGLELRLGLEAGVGAGVKVEAVHARCPPRKLGTQDT